MSRELARIDIANVVASIIAAHTDYPLVVQMSNRDNVDQALQENPYLQVSVKWLKGLQMDMSPHPLVGNFGQILIASCVKKGAGEKAANLLLDFCTPFFELKQLANIRTQVVQPGNESPVNDWFYVTSFINFDMYRLSS